MAARQDSLDQLIPTDWVRQAQRRWTPRPPQGIPMCAIGVDVAQGGPDRTVLAARHDGWFAPIESFPGIDTPGGHEVAGLVISRRKDQALVVIDMGGGYGGAAKEHLQDNGVHVVPYKGVMKANKRSTKEQYEFGNVRSQAYWMFREALDPNQPGGSSIALPDDPELVQELTSYHFKIEARGIIITKKDDVKLVLGRSPDKADAVIMAWFAGPKGYQTPEEWAKHLSKNSGRNYRPEVIRQLPGKRKR